MLDFLETHTNTKDTFKTLKVFTITSIINAYFIGAVFYLMNIQIYSLVSLRHLLIFQKTSIKVTQIHFIHFSKIMELITFIM